MEKIQTKEKYSYNMQVENHCYKSIHKNYKYIDDYVVIDFSGHFETV